MSRNVLSSLTFVRSLKFSGIKYINIVIKLFFKCLVEFTQSRLVTDLILWFLIIDSISLGQITFLFPQNSIFVFCLFLGICPFYLVDLIYLVIIVCGYYDYVLFIFVTLIAMVPLLFLIFILVNPAKCHLGEVFQRTSGFFFYLLFFLFSILCIYALLLFLLPVLALVFSSPLMCKLMLFIWDLPSFLMWVFTTINFSLSTAFAMFGMF